VAVAVWAFAVQACSPERTTDAVDAAIADSGTTFETDIANDGALSPESDAGTPSERDGETVGDGESADTTTVP